MAKTVILLLIVIINTGYSQMNKTHSIVSSAPKAEKVPHQHIYHNDIREDNYHWLRDDDRKDPKVLDYLAQENNYTDSVLNSEKPLIDKLYQEIIARLPSKE